MVEDQVSLNIRKGIGQGVVENYMDWLRQDGKSREELLRGLALFFFDEDRVGGLAQLVYEEAVRMPDGMTGTASPELEAAIGSESLAQFTRALRELDALSQLSAMTSSGRRGGEPYALFRESVWLGGIEEAGTFGLIHGPGLGIGKTGFAVRLMPVAIGDLDLDVITNVRTSPPEAQAGRVHLVSRLSQVMRIALGLEKDGKHTLLVLDESSFFFGRQDANKGSVKDFDKFLRWLRKLNLRLILITHFEERDIPEKAKPFFTTNIRKESKKSMRVEIRGGKLPLTKRIHSVPDAEWPYETKGKGGLEIDVDVADLHDKLNARGFKSADEERAYMISYLERQESRRIENEELDDEPPEAPVSVAPLVVPTGPPAARDDDDLAREIAFCKECKDPTKMKIDANRVSLHHTHAAATNKELKLNRAKAFHLRGMANIIIETVPPTGPLSGQAFEGVYTQ